MSPISTRKATPICKRRKVNHDALLVRLDENKIEQYERTHSNNSDTSSDGLLSLENSSECSSSNVDEKSDFAKYSSARDLCIFVLSSHGLLLNKREDTDTRIITSQNKMRSLKCKSCASVGQSTKMLICDNCEGPFHLKCSGMLLRKALPEEWYCHPCSRNKRRRKSGKAILKSKNLMRSKQLIEERILKYTSSVRIGEAFQADVQEWFGPLYDDDDYHEKLEEIRPGKLCYLNVQKSNKNYTYCNWIQCREEIKGTLCGKWRRAPLFEIQTDNWDCSCSLMWDPSYADCAVPQELETSEVMKHLEYINLSLPFNETARSAEYKPLKSVEASFGSERDQSEGYSRIVWTLCSRLAISTNSHLLQ